VRVLAADRQSEGHRAQTFAGCTFVRVGISRVQAGTEVVKARDVPWSSVPLP
jgi:hypothetical protein